MTLQELDARIDARIRTVLEGTGSKASSWAQEELARAIAHGITDGTRPGGYATREEVALMAERAYSGHALTKFEIPVGRIFSQTVKKPAKPKVTEGRKV